MRSLLLALRVILVVAGVALGGYVGFLVADGWSSPDQARQLDHLTLAVLALLLVTAAAAARPGARPETGAVGSDQSVATPPSGFRALPPPGQYRPGPMTGPQPGLPLPPSGPPTGSQPRVQQPGGHHQPAGAPHNPTWAPSGPPASISDGPTAQQQRPAPDPEQQS